MGASLTITPITVGVGDWESLEQLGKSLAAVIRRIAPETLMVASSDMNHYESDTVTRIKDARAIDRLLKRDALGLWETVRRERISMCGFGPSCAVITAANALGASSAELIRYATSAETSGDYNRVVGYADRKSTRLNSSH